MNRSFTPWVGDKYADAANVFGCKVLVFGESVYCGRSDEFARKGCREKGCVFERGLYDEECAGFLTRLRESDDLDVLSSAFCKFSARMAPGMNPL